jgi:hypothetical protein
MSDVLRSLEPQPRWVYWLRRALVGGALVLVLVLVFTVVRGLRADGEEPAGGDPAATEGAETDDAAEAAGDETTASDVTRPCGAADLQLALTSDAAAYPAGATATFTVAITNVSGQSCTVDAGNASLELLITSGPDRIWSSLDCAVAGAEGAERMLLLADGAQEASAVQWSRTRSDESCSANLPEPRPGTYHAVATLVGAESNDLVFTLD